MPRFISSVFTATWLLFVASQTGAGGQEASAASGWVQLPSDGETSARAFVVVKNPTMYDVYVVSAASGVSGKVEIRDAVGDDAKTVGEITVPAYGTLRMKADGVHLRLVDLERPLEEGETVRLTLTTDGSVKLLVRAVVRKTAPSP